MINSFATISVFTGNTALFTHLWLVYKSFLCIEFLFACSKNELVSTIFTGVEGCNLLKKFDCSVNYLSGELDMSNYPHLYTLNCGANSITAIDVEACTAMTTLTCDNTLITELNVSTLTLLESLVANDCMLTVMDCSNNLSLKTLHLQGNPLTSLILAQGQGIADLKVDNFDVISYKE